LEVIICLCENLALLIGAAQLLKFSNMHVPLTIFSVAAAASSNSRIFLIITKFNIEYRENPMAATSKEKEN
jgi:hypothetical protein